LLCVLLSGKTGGMGPEMKKMKCDASKLGHVTGWGNMGGKKTTMGKRKDPF